MNLTPDVVTQLVATFGPVGAFALIMWLNRPKQDVPKQDPVADLVAEVRAMNARLVRVETILEERK